jgi:hypothetical protein
VRPRRSGVDADGAAVERGLKDADGGVLEDGPKLRLSQAGSFVRPVSLRHVVGGYQHRIDAVELDAVTDDFHVDERSVLPPVPPGFGILESIFARLGEVTD